MKQKLITAFKRNETYVVAGVIGIVFFAAMCVLVFSLRNSIARPAYEVMTNEDLKSVFVTAYLRHREDNGSPYLKVELHNGSLWWIKKVDFAFDGVEYSLKDPEAFKPLRFGAVRCPLKTPVRSTRMEYDLHISRASGYPPADFRRDPEPGKVAGASVLFLPKN